MKRYDQCSLKPCNINRISYNTPYSIVGLAPDDMKPIIICALELHTIIIKNYDT